MPVNGARILVIEDNRDLALGLRVNLVEVEYEVQVAHTIGDGLARLRQFRPELVVLDVTLPDGDGLDFMRRLRAAQDKTLVLVLTARAERDARLLGLRLGADDYVTKPFDLEELLLRVEVLLRRSRPADAAPLRVADERFAFGEFDVDVAARTVRRGAEPVAISRVGFDLLVALLRQRGSVVARAELMRDVLGYAEDVATRTLDTHIFELRRQLEVDPASPVYIRTVWRIGYRFE